jgi:phenylacetate-CoA ligase
MTVDDQALDEAVQRYAAGLAPAVADLVRRAGSVPALATRLAAAGLSGREVRDGDVTALHVLT